MVGETVLDLDLLLLMPPLGRTLSVVVGSVDADAGNIHGRFPSPTSMILSILRFVTIETCAKNWT